MPAARIVLGRDGLDQAVVAQGTQDPAEIARVEPEVAAELGGGRAVAVRQLVEHARLGEGERAAGQTFVQEADLPRVEAVEAPHVGYALVEMPVRHHACESHIIS